MARLETDPGSRGEFNSKFVQQMGARRLLPDRKRRRELSDDEKDGERKAFLIRATTKKQQEGDDSLLKEYIRIGMSVDTKTFDDLSLEDSGVVRSVGKKSKKKKKS